MTTIKDIFHDYGPEYIRRYGDRMPADHCKVIEAIINCRSSHYGASIYQCTQCGKNHVFTAAVVIATAPIASSIKASSGCKPSWIANCPGTIL